jgi:hypothetical protein
VVRSERTSLLPELLFTHPHRIDCHTSDAIGRRAAMPEFSLQETKKTLRALYNGSCTSVSRLRTIPLMSRNSSSRHSTTHQQVPNEFRQTLIGPLRRQPWFWSRLAGKTFSEALYKSSLFKHLLDIVADIERGGLRNKASDLPRRLSSYPKAQVACRRLYDYLEQACAAFGGEMKRAIQFEPVLRPWCVRDMDEHIKCAYQVCRS